MHILPYFSLYDIFAMDNALSHILPYIFALFNSALFFLFYGTVAGESVN